MASPRVDESERSVRPLHGSWRSPFTVRALIACLLVQGMSALAGGIPLIVDPSGRWLGMDAGMLGAAPVDSFLLPGLVLTIPLGLVPVVVAISLRRPASVGALPTLARRTGRAPAWSAALAVGIGLVFWIAIEAFFIEWHWLQLAFGVLGLLIIALTSLPSVREHYNLDRRALRPE